MDRFSPYEYLAYLVPGATLVGTAQAVDGWPSSEPGVTSLTILILIAFVVGHAVAAIGSWTEPAFWGSRPGAPANPLWGLFGNGRPYGAADYGKIESALQARLGSDEPLPVVYRIARVRLQQLNLDGPLIVLNQQIGFYRNMTVSLLIGLAMQFLWLIAGASHLAPLPWLLLYPSGAALFAYRYRRFWTYYGVATIRGIEALAPHQAVGT